MWRSVRVAFAVESWRYILHNNHDWVTDNSGRIKHDVEYDSFNVMNRGEGM